MARLQGNLLKAKLLRDEVFRVEQQRRRRIRHELLVHAESARSVAELVGSVEVARTGTSQARLKELAAVATMEDKAILTVASQIRALWPPVARKKAGDDDALKPIDEVVQFLDRNAARVAGIEQLFLNLLSLPPSNTDGLAVAIQHLGRVLPEPFHAAAENLLHSAQAAQFGEVFYGLAGDVVRGVAKEFAVKVVEQGPSVAEATFLASSPEALSVVRVGMLTGLVEGLGKQGLDAAVSFSDSQPIFEALSHLSHLGALEGVSGAHVPVITLMLSVHREARLLKAGMTSVDIAVKNVALDIAGTGGGAFAGAAAGATTGSIIGSVVPLVGTAVGAGVGGVVGAVYGAFKGRETTNEIKAIPFEKAKADLERERSEYPERVHRLQVTLCEAVSEKAKTGRRAFIRAIGSPPLTNGSRASEWRTVAINLRDTARHEAESAWTTVAKARQWAASDHELAANLARIAPALDGVEGAITITDQRLGSGEYAAGILAMTSIPMKLSTDVCIDEEERLLPLVEDRRRAVATWTIAATDHFKSQLKLFVDAVAPDYRAYRDGHAQVIAAVNSAEAAYKREADHLGLKK